MISQSHNDFGTDWDLNPQPAGPEADMLPLSQIDRKYCKMDMHVIIHVLGLCLLQLWKVNTLTFSQF